MWVGWYRRWRLLDRRAGGGFTHVTYRLAFDLYGVPRNDVAAVSAGLLGAGRARLRLRRGHRPRRRHDPHRRPGTPDRRAAGDLAMARAGGGAGGSGAVRVPSRGHPGAPTPGARPAGFATRAGGRGFGHGVGRDRPRRSGRKETSAARATSTGTPPGRARNPFSRRSTSTSPRTPPTSRARPRRARHMQQYPRRPPPMPPRRLRTHDSKPAASLRSGRTARRGRATGSPASSSKASRTPARAASRRGSPRRPRRRQPSSCRPPSPGPRPRRTGSGCWQSSPPLCPFLSCGIRRLRWRPANPPFPQPSPAD